MTPPARQSWFALAIIGLVVCSLPLALWGTGPGPTISHSPILHSRTPDGFEQIVKPFLQTYCLNCHRGESPEGDLALDGFNSQADVESDPDTWETIMEAVNDQYMPPSDEKQPEAREIIQLKDWYQRHQESQGNVGPVVPKMRRLNRFEYENTVRDLLRLDGDAFANPERILLLDEYFEPRSRKMPSYILAMSHFSYNQKRAPLLGDIPAIPVDPPVEHGYSNDHTGLSFSPLQMERYMELANAIVSSPNLKKISGLWTGLFLPVEGHDIPRQHVDLAKNRLAVFLPRAFRRPATPDEIERFTNLFQRELEATGQFTEAMKSTVAGVLVSPSFLFRRDFSSGSFDETGADSFAMASRLSYFLWASMPDEQLFQAAAEQRLSTPAEILEQVQRMVMDKKVKTLATDFGMQWLQVASVASARPDRDMFPRYYISKNVNPGVSMMIEQLLLFETIMIEDRSIMEFVHTDFAYLNRNLMDWYQMNPKKVLGFTPDVQSFEDYFRITWDNKHRGGAITSGATLLSTSATTRSSPVYRGAWILSVVFNRPPPPPPADVPALEDVEHDAGTVLGMREKLKRHRQDPNCTVCHERMDPLGLALEKFDTVGRFRRTYEDGTTLDTRGTIFDEEFDGAARFKAVILRHERSFVQGFVEHMLKYALGRSLELSDEKDVGKIVDAVIARGKNFSCVVEEIAVSDLFRSAPRQGQETSGQR